MISTFVIWFFGMLASVTRIVLPVLSIIGIALLSALRHLGIAFVNFIRYLGRNPKAAKVVGLILLGIVAFIVVPHLVENTLMSQSMKNTLVPSMILVLIGAGIVVLVRR
jgi:hypothetical protein